VQIILITFLCNTIELNNVNKILFRQNCFTHRPNCRLCKRGFLSGLLVLNTKDSFCGLKAPGYLFSTFFRHTKFFQRVQSFLLTTFKIK